MRPPAPRAKVDGTHFEVVEEPLTEWRAIAPTLARPCRYAVDGAGGRSCKAPSVAAMNRGRRSFTNGERQPSWWHYCGDHLYGRWVEDGKVFQWRLVNDEVPA